MAKRSEHKWQDDALQPDGRAWVAGVRFRCARGCGVERRVILTGKDGSETASVYVMGNVKVKGGVPECSPPKN